MIKEEVICLQEYNCISSNKVGCLKEGYYNIAQEVVPWVSC